jgi:hypothetical protein
MSKKIIRLTESDLHNIIKKSVQKILREAGEDFTSPLDRVRNSKHPSLGKIDNFNPNNGYVVVDGQGMPLEQAKAMARQEIVDYLQTNGTKMSIGAYRGEGYGTIEIETDNGWYFIAEDIPVDIEIEQYSYYNSATYWHPEEYGDTEGYVDGVDYKAIPFLCYPPSNLPDNKQKPFELQVDDELAQLLDEKCDTSDIDDALQEMEQYAIDNAPEPPDYEPWDD